MTALFLLMLVLTLAGVAGALWLVRSEHRPGLVVLLYHRLRTRTEWDTIVGPERHFSVPAERFEAQLLALKQAGWTFVDEDAVYAVVQGASPAPRSAFVTFDDGSASVHTTAWPILSALQVPSATYVTADPGAWVFEDQPRISADGLAELAGQGMSIGAHGVSHHALNEMDDARLKAELDGSRSQLADVIGRPVVDMAIPLNFYDERVLSACRDAQYRMVFTANPGRIRPGADPIGLPRVTIEGTMSPTEVLKAVSPGRMVQRRIVQALKRVPPRLLGEARWMPLRRRIFASSLGRRLTFGHLRRALGIACLTWLILLISLGFYVL